MLLGGQVDEQIRAYFRGIVTPEYEAEIAATEGGGPHYMKALRQMGADGWLGVGWPKEYGGQGRTPIEQFIFFDEAWRAGALLPTLTIMSVSPMWLIVGQLNHERVVLIPVGPTERFYEEVRDWARETRLPDGRRVIDQPWVQHNLARVRAGVEVLKLLNWRQAWNMTRGEMNYAESSTVKVYGSEFYVEAYRLLLEVLGQAGYVKAGSPAALLRGRLERLYRAILIMTFGAGTNEVQREIIAMGGLGMPRSR